MWAELKADCKMLTRNEPSSLKRAVKLLSSRSMQAVILYRLGHGLWKRRIPLIPMILTRIAQHLCAVDIAYQATIGPGLVIVHGFGVVIGSAVTIEGECCIFHGVTFGDRGSEWVGS